MTLSPKSRPYLYPIPGDPGSRQGFFFFTPSLLVKRMNLGDYYNSINSGGFAIRAVPIDIHRAQKKPGVKPGFDKTNFNTLAINA